MENGLKSKSIYEIPRKQIFTGKDKWLRLQKHIITDRMPPVSEDESLFMFVSGGSGTITVNGVEFPFETGSFAWLQSYHTFTLEPSPGDVLALSVCVYDYPLCSFLTFREPTEDVMLSLTDIPPIMKLEGARLARTRTLFDEFEAEDLCFDPGSSLIKVSILGQFSTYFVGSSIRRLKSEERTLWPLGWRAVHYISCHFMEPLTAESVAALFDADGAALNRELRKISGSNFAQTLNRVRVNIATAALLFEDLSLSYIAARSGFPTEVAFYRSFRKYWGETPQEHRERMLSSGEGVYRGMIMGAALMSTMDYIYTNFSEQISIKAMAKESYASESTIRDLISEKFGVSCKDVIALNRIRHAEALLLTTDRPILDIAVEVGFNSSRTFSRAFQKMNAMTPGAYRDKYRGGTST